MEIAHTLTLFLVPFIQFMAGDGPKLELGWTDGSADRIKYVPAKVESINYTTHDLVIRYDWGNGKIKLHCSERAEDHADYQGTWKQDGDSKGGAFLRFERNRDQANGYWTKQGEDARYGMFLREARP